MPCTISRFVMFSLLVSGGFVNFVQTRLSASLISGSDLELGNDLIVKGDATFGTAASDRVTIKGNLFIEGTATEISTTNLAVEDQFILLNSYLFLNIKDFSNS